MATHGVDISKYQEPSTMDGFQFVLVNSEDPSFNTKIERAKARGIPWGPYSWVYPGNGGADMARAVNRAQPHGPPPLGYWLDYEQAGVRQSDIDMALQRASELGVIDRTGIYTYLYLIDGVNLRGRPLWLAYYPGFNDGSYPAGQDLDAKRHGTVMWQYTSGANAPVGLDRNVVIDEGWFSAFTGSTPGDDFDMDDDKFKQLVLEALTGWHDGFPTPLGSYPGAVPFGYTTWKEAFVDLVNKVRAIEGKVGEGDGTIDYAALAKAVNDDAAERMKK